MIKEKLNILRDKLRWWNKKLFRWIDLKVDEDVKQLNEYDELLGVNNDEMNIEIVGKIFLEKMEELTIQKKHD